MIGKRDWQRFRKDLKKDLEKALKTFPKGSGEQQTNHDFERSSLLEQICESKSHELP
jgi:hypothetical protein